MTRIVEHCIMESKIFSDLPMVKNAQRPRLPIVKKVINKDFPDIYSLNSDQEGLGVMCIDFVLKINYLGIFYKPQLVPYFSNNLLTAGSCNYNEFEISQLLQNLGAHFHCETNRMHSVISIYFMSSQIKKVLSVISNFILSPTYPEKLIKDRISNEKQSFMINMERLSVHSRRRIKKKLYGELHPYGELVEKADFEKISSKELIAFHRDFYNSDNLEIIISGDIPKGAVGYIYSAFSKVKKPSSDYIFRENSIFKSNRNILTPPFSKPSSDYISRDSALQTAFRVAKILPGPSHKDFFALRVLVTILGGYFGSRLMKKIREEKGYTYGIGAYLVVEEKYSELHIVTEVGEKYTKLVLEEIIKEMEMLQNKEVGLQELDRVKAYLLGSLLHSCDGIFNQAILFRSLKRHNSSFNYINSFTDEIVAVTANKITKTTVPNKAISCTNWYKINKPTMLITQ